MLVVLIYENTRNPPQTSCSLIVNYTFADETAINSLQNGVGYVNLNLFSA